MFAPRRPRRRPARFVRFVVGVRSEPVHALTGVFAISRELLDADRLESWEADRLREIYRWFNENLPCPPFRAKLDGGEWTSDAVAWYRHDAIWMIRRMWEIVALLREHDEPVRFVRSEEPGRILYSDDWQIVADSRSGGRCDPH